MSLLCCWCNHIKAVTKAAEGLSQKDEQISSIYRHLAHDLLCHICWRSGCLWLPDDVSLALNDKSIYSKYYSRYGMFRNVSFIDSGGMAGTFTYAITMLNSYAHVLMYVNHIRKFAMGAVFHV